MWNATASSHSPRSSSTQRGVAGCATYLPTARQRAPVQSGSIGGRPTRRQPSAGQQSLRTWLKASQNCGGYRPARLVFQWETVDPDARIHFFYAAESLHGLAYSAVLECDVVDTGEIRVSATLLERFCDGSLWHCGECPPLVVKRYRTSTVDVAGQPVTLWIESVLTTPASIFPSCP